MTRPNDTRRTEPGTTDYERTDREPTDGSPTDPPRTDRDGADRTPTARTGTPSDRRTGSTSGAKPATDDGNDPIAPLVRTTGKPSPTLRRG